ncbi:FliH/SctL family protein [Pandoraea apista]|uniref:FliH/SctL family protein n=1 Tax=Pandoraea apista TaxID=93218 RepID=UPI000F674A42|nr:FliH/SctL family protein [Pandoraea apista]RRW88803.1 flagellar assembly protein H [Pandoraea apista]RRW98062.1 flagellar assembly protein H [Pandoraea apista]
MKSYQRYRFPSLRSLREGAQSSNVVHTNVEIVEDTSIDLDQRIEDGYREGVARGQLEGRQQGFDALRAEYEGVALTLDAMRGAFDKMQAEYLAARRTELVDIVARVAKQVIRCELTLQPSQMISLIEETLASMPVASGDPEVRLNPMECERLSNLFPERVRAWRLVADTELETGECLVRRGTHEADAGCRHRLDACMHRVSEQLLAASAVDAAPDEERTQPAQFEVAS